MLRLSGFELYSRWVSLKKHVQLAVTGTFTISPLNVYHRAQPDYPDKGYSACQGLISDYPELI